MERGGNTPNISITGLPFRQPPPAHMPEGTYIPDRSNQGTTMQPPVSITSWADSAMTRLALHRAVIVLHTIIARFWCWVSHGLT